MAKGKMIGSYVPSQLTVVVSIPDTGGTHVITDFSEDSAIDIERGNPAWTWSPSLSGGGSYVHNADETATVTLHLQQTSESNDVLSRIVRYDQNKFRGEGIISVAIADNSGRTALFSTMARVSMMPNQSFGSDVATLDWQLIMPYSDWHVGGNAKIGSDVQATLSALGYEVDESWLINEQIG